VAAGEKPDAVNYLADLTGSERSAAAQTVVTDQDRAATLKRALDEASYNGARPPEVVPEEDLQRSDAALGNLYPPNPGMTFASYCHLDNDGITRHSKSASLL
jgi:hypothetical protein